MEGIRINLIYLAAGYARRFGANKLLAEIQGKPLYWHGFSCMLALRKRLEEDGITIFPAVVTSYGEIESCCLEYGIVSSSNRGEENDGIASSIKKGLLLCEEEEEACEAAGILCGSSYDMFLTADQPGLDASVLYEFLRSFLHQQRTMGAMEYRDVLRSPNIFAACWRDELKRLSKDTGGKSILNAHREAVFTYPVTDGSQFQDIDTPKDYRKLTDRQKNGGI